MNDTEREALMKAIDVTLACAGLVVELRREVRALKSLAPESQYETAFLEADERGESLYEKLLGNSRQLAAAKDSLRKAGTEN